VAAIELTLLVAAIALPLNLVLPALPPHGVSPNSASRKERADHADRLPFSVSPVVSGLIYVLIFEPAGLVRRLAARARLEDHLRGAGTSCSRRSSSRFRSSLAS
jgi:ABC-type sulfate transport system permease subunit